MSFVQDRWTREVKDADGKVTREPTERYGQGKRYKARYFDPDGRERSKSFPDGRKREADAFVRAQSTDISRGTWTDPKAGTVTLREYALSTWLPAQGGAPNTRDRLHTAIHQHILPVLGGRQLGDLAAHPTVIQQWVKGLRMAEITALHTFGILSSLLSAAVDDGKIPRNPCRTSTVKAPTVPKRLVVPWEAERVAAVRAGLLERLRPLVDCGAGLGMRQGEVFGLAPGDIDWLRNIVHVRRQLRVTRGRMTVAPPKGGKMRDIPLPESVKLSLAAHMEAVTPVRVQVPLLENDGKLQDLTLLFPSERGHALRASNFDRLSWKAALEDAGVPVGRENGFHALRHHFASVLLAAGVDIRKLAAYLGHEDPAFTLRVYAHLMPDGGDSMRNAIDSAAATAQGRNRLPGGQAERRSQR